MGFSLRRLSVRTIRAPRVFYDCLPDDTQHERLEKVIRRPNQESRFALVISHVIYFHTTHTFHIHHDVPSKSSSPLLLSSSSSSSLLFLSTASFRHPLSSAANVLAFSRASFFSRKYVPCSEESNCFRKYRPSTATISQLRGELF